MTFFYSDIFQVLVTFAAAFLVTVLLIPHIIKFSKKHNLVDNPNARKVHKEPIPTMGGVGIFAGFVIAVLGWMIYFDDIAFLIIGLGLVILFVMGMLDDKLDLSAKLKFLIQTLVALLIAYYGIRIESLNGFLFINELPVWVQYAFSVFLVVGLTNAFNLIDGIDGLAGGLAFINSLVLGIVLLLTNNPQYAILAFGFAGAMLGFLKFNFNPAKLFMGDTGSLLIGFMMAVLGIVAIKGFDGPDAMSEEMKSGITTIVFGTLLIPVYDTLRVFGERVAKGTSPFAPDKNHVHHLLIETGSNHKRAAITLYIADIIIILTAFLLRYQNPTLSIPILVVLTLVMSHGLNFIGMKIFTEKTLQVEQDLETKTDDNRFLIRVAEPKEKKKDLSLKRHLKPTKLKTDPRQFYLVEDNKMFALTVRKGLETKYEGYKVKIFHTGEEMMEHLKTSSIIPGLIILDFYLNSDIQDAKNGDIILQDLKTFYKQKGLPQDLHVLMLTSSNELKLAVVLLQKGASDYIIKNDNFMGNLCNSINKEFNL